MRRLAIIVSIATVAALAACDGPRPAHPANQIEPPVGNIVIPADECPRTDGQPCR